MVPNQYKKMECFSNNKFVTISSLHELVQDGVNGHTFKNTDQLSKQIVSWFDGFPNNETQNKLVEATKAELTKFQKSRWEDNWNLRVKGFFES